MQNEIWKGELFFFFKEQLIVELCNNCKSSNTSKTKVSEGDCKQFANFPNVMKSITTQIQET
jgi:hypothetical protein